MHQAKKPNFIIRKFIKQFIENHKEDNIKIEGIILFGSYAYPKKISKNSDLDLYLVIKNNGKRYRGIKYIDNVEVDYFINPFIQLESDFENAINSSKKTIIFMLADGKILKDSGNKINKLKKRAKELIKKENKQGLPKFMLTFVKYFIDDYLKDIKDNYNEKDFFAWQYNKNLLLNYLIEVFCKNKKILLVKPKYQKEEIKKRDQNFVKLYESISNEKNNQEQMAKIKKLSEYVLDSLGGKLPREWESESQIKL